MRLAPALVLAGLLALLLGIFEHVYHPMSRQLMPWPATATSGDEPHYLLVINSLLFDHDLALQEDYRRVWRGSADAGTRVAGRRIDHHSIVLDRDTGAHDYWLNVFDVRKPIACPPGSCMGFGRRSWGFEDARHLEERSAHPIGFPVLVAALVGLTRPTAAEVERRALFVQLACVFCGLLLIYRLARRAGLTPAAALAPLVLLGLCSPWLGYSRSLFCEPMIGLLLLAALDALQEERLATVAVFLGLAIFIKVQFALVGLAWAAERWRAGRRRFAGRLLAAVGGATALTVAGNLWQTRMPLLTGNQPWLSSHSLQHALRTLVDARWGLLPFAPWAAVALGGLYRALERARPAMLMRLPPPNEVARERLLLQMALPTALLLGLFMSYAFLGESCYGPRYWVPLLPMLALATTLTMMRAGLPTRLATCGLALLGAASALPSALQYPLVWNQEPYFALASLLR